jgi:uncharacterized protein YqjF (DUF2071 family)
MATFEAYVVASKYWDVHHVRLFLRSGRVITGAVYNPERGAVRVDVETDGKERIIFVSLDAIDAVEVDFDCGFSGVE